MVIKDNGHGPSGDVIHVFIAKPNENWEIVITFDVLYLASSIGSSQESP